jgi:hypothetical protein
MTCALRQIFFGWWNHGRWDGRVCGNICGRRNIHIRFRWWYGQDNVVCDIPRRLKNSIAITGRRKEVYLFSKTPKPALCGRRSFLFSTEDSFETSGHAAPWFKRDLPYYHKFWSIFLTEMGRDTSVGITTRYGLDGPGFESLWGRDYLHPSRPALGYTQSPVQWVTGLFPEGKEAGALGWPLTTTKRWS